MPAAAAEHRSHASAWAALALLVAAIALAYANSLRGPLVYDDIQAVAENGTIRSLATALRPPPGGLTVSGRPVLNFSFAVSQALGHGAIGAHHAVNGLVHAGAALLLFGLVRRTAEATGVRSTGPGVGPVTLAWTVALLWALHPLQTQAVTYIVQRAESLMGFWYFLTLYTFVRGGGARDWTAGAPREAQRPWAASGWLASSVMACTLGMATKEVMVTAPVVVLLYDRTFVAGSFRAAWRARRGYYLALAATWLLLGALVLGAGGNRGGTAGLGVGVPLWAYPLTQFEAVTHYLWLGVWPHPLVFEYGTRWVNRVADVIPYVAIVLPLVTLTVVALQRWPVAGFLGAAFFLVLAPTSFTPGTIQMIVEHRMYLSLAAVLTLLLLGLRVSLGARAGPAVTALALAFATLTIARNADYRSHLALWSDTVAKRPYNPRAHVGLAEAYAELGRLEDAIREYAEVVRLEPGESRHHYNLAMTLARAGRWQEAIRGYEASLRLTPTEARTHNNLAIALGKTGRDEEALHHYVEAERLAPGEALYPYNHGVALERMGHVADAIARYEAALRLKPDYVDAHTSLATALLAGGRANQAQAHFERALQLAPDDAQLRVAYGNSLVLTDQPVAALAQFQRVLQHEPNHVAARFGLAQVFARQRRFAEAVAQYESLLRQAPDDANAHFKFGDALLDLGRTTDAVGHYETGLRLAPDDAEGHHNLGAAYARLERWPEAEQEFATALRLKPEYAAARTHLEQVRQLLRR